MIPASVASALSDEFGTPLYLYDLSEIGRRVAELRAVLPAGSTLLYSMKANPLPAVVSAARQAGCGVEISSRGELASAIRAGFDPLSILYSGPGKDDRGLQDAVRAGVGCFSAESWQDVTRIAAAATRLGTVARVIVRVNPADAPRASLAMTGVPSPFGFDADDLARLHARMVSLPGVDIAGVHVYLGTQAAGVDALAAMFRVALDAAERFAAVMPVRIADLGGGFPWPYAVNGAGPDLRPLAAVLDPIGARRHLADAAFWFESGRYVAASCGTLVARLTDVKRSRGTTFYVLDAGVSHLGGMHGLGRVLRPPLSLVPIDGGTDGETIVADVVGPLCTPLDCLARGARMPLLEPGALVAIPNVGAYGATAGLTSFLSRPAAIEVSLRGECIVDVARLRGGHEAIAVREGVG
jgi:diaminopimelate decarboxylase